MVTSLATAALLPGLDLRRLNLGWWDGQHRVPKGSVPVRPAVTGHVERKFKASPDSQFVKCRSKIIFHYLLAGPENGSYVFVG
jgi:hypothetical protein